MRLIVPLLTGDKTAWKSSKSGIILTRNWPINPDELNKTTLIQTTIDPTNVRGNIWTKASRIAISPLILLSFVLYL